jgi:type IV secretory pathway VirB10-like protein
MLLLIQKQDAREYHMRFIFTGFVLVLIILANSELSADKVYTWTDKDGNMHITAEPPPQNARVKDVLQYEPRPDQNIPAAEQPERSTESEAPAQKPVPDSVLRARARAEKARQEAEAARARAEEATQAAKKYIETHNRNEYMRRAYKYQMRKAAEEAKTAQEQARISEEKAIEAEKKVKFVEERARQLGD